MQARPLNFLQPGVSAMRIRKLALAILLSTTCLATPAKAEPVSGFLMGMWTGLSTGAVAGAGVAGAFATGMNAGAWLVGGSFLSQMVVSIGMSAISMGLAPKPQMPSAGEVMANYAQDVAWQDRVYGRVRKGGPFALAAYANLGMTTPNGDDPSRKRHYGVLIAAHSTRGPVQHYLDKWPVEINPQGWVTTEPVCLDGTWYHGAIRTYTGKPGQGTDPIWRAAFPEVTAADNFAGLSYAALHAAKPGDKDFQRIYPGGREWVYAPVWDGCDTVYDPRTDSRGWTDNAALIIADVALWYGKEVDWAEVAAEANVCDQIVTNRDGGSQKRWTINTVLRSNMTWEQARAHLMMAVDGWFYERTDGKLGFKVGYYAAPILTLTAEDFLGLSLRHKAQGPDEVGSYALRYIEPARDWNEEVSGAVVVNLLGDRSEEVCGAIDSHNQAWRVIYRWAKAAQAEWQISGTLKMIGYDCLGERFLRIQHAELDLDIVVEVAMLSRIAGTHQWSVEAVSVVSADFAPNALTLEPPPTLRAKIEDDAEVPAPASLTGEVIPGSGGAATIEVTWPAQSREHRQQVQYRAPSAGLHSWQIIDAGSDQTSLVLVGLIDRATYEIQVRNRTGGNRVSAWSPSVPLAVVAVANTSAPAAMQYVNGVAAGSNVGLSFIPPNDPAYSAARIYRATGSTAFGNAALVRTEFGAPNLADEWTDVSPGTGAHSYWFEPINGSGIGGPLTGPITINII